jgi:hypothetical protein
MKSLLSALLFSVMFAPAAQAFALVCDNEMADYAGQVGFKGGSQYECVAYEVRTKYRYYLEIDTRGLGLSFQGQSGFVITCPTISKRAFGTKEFTTKRGKDRVGAHTFHGAMVSAGLVLGVDGMGMVSNRGDICAVAGLSENVGANISGLKMTVSRSEYDTRRW